MDSQADIESRLENFREDMAKNSMAGIQGQIDSINKMEESQNFVLKDCHEKVQNIVSRLLELEKTDFDDKFNHITRKMIGEVAKEVLTPIQMGFNMEIKSIKKLVEEHAYSLE